MEMAFRGGEVGLCHIAQHAMGLRQILVAVRKVRRSVETGAQFPDSAVQCIRRSDRDQRLAEPHAHQSRVATDVLDRTRERIDGICRPVGADQGLALQLVKIGVVRLLRDQGVDLGDRLEPSNGFIELISRLIHEVVAGRSKVRRPAHDSELFRYGLRLAPALGRHSGADASQEARAQIWANHVEMWQFDLEESAKAEAERQAKALNAVLDDFPDAGRIFSRAFSTSPETPAVSSDIFRPFLEVILSMEDKDPEETGRDAFERRCACLRALASDLTLVSRLAPRLHDDALRQFFIAEAFEVILEDWRAERGVQRWSESNFNDNYWALLDLDALGRQAGIGSAFAIEALNAPLPPDGDRLVTLMLQGPDMAARKAIQKLSSDQDRVDRLIAQAGRHRDSQISAT